MCSWAHSIIQAARHESICIVCGAAPESHSPQLTEQRKGSRRNLRPTRNRVPGRRGKPTTMHCWHPELVRLKRAHIPARMRVC